MNDRVVLLDRDGTIIVERHYLSDHRQVELLPRAALGVGGRGYGAKAGPG